jgi:hypothetical protein
VELKEIETLWEVGFRERAEVVSYYLEKEKGGGRGERFCIWRESWRGGGGETEREKFF